MTENRGMVESTADMKLEEICSMNSSQTHWEKKKEVEFSILKMFQAVNHQY